MGGCGTPRVRAARERSLAEIAVRLREHEHVGLDTSVFIYHFEASREFAAPAGSVLQALARGDFLGVTSVLTLMEVSVKPLQLGRQDVADEYEILLSNYPNLLIADVTRSVTRRAATLRATHRLKPADAVQVAACIEHGATAFVTNDRDLHRLTEIDVLILGDFVQQQKP